MKELFFRYLCGRPKDLPSELWHGCQGKAEFYSDIFSAQLFRLAQTLTL